MIKLLSLLLLIILSTSIRVDTNNTLFIDQYGRYRIFHGVNAVQKLFPFHPIIQHFDVNRSLTDVDFENLKGWGFNVIRLHVAWQGVQPQKQKYNYTYIQTLRKIVRKANKYDISIILDAHQDLYNKQFCGQGFPDWAVKRTNFPFPLPINMDYDQKGLPNRTKCLSIQFAAFYTTEDVMRTQQQFFTNKNGILDSFGKMWQRVAAYMSDQPNILGYEFLNQPIGANAYRHPSDVIMPGQSNNKYLKPAYQKLYKYIREVDQKNLIFYEPSVLDVFGQGFYQTLGDESQKSKQVFSYHIYCPLVTNTGQPRSTAFCRNWDQLQIYSKQLNAQKMKTGAMLTQFGALSNSLKSAQQVTILLDQMTKYFRSWSYWQFKYFDDITSAAMPSTTQSFYDQDGFLQQNKVKALARPYATAICGTPINEQFKNNIYKLQWYGNKDCFNMNTQIFLSTAFYYPIGFQHSFKNCKGCKLVPKQDQGYYQVIFDKVRLFKPIQLIVKPLKNKQQK